MRWLTVLLAVFTALLPHVAVADEHVLRSTSLNTCQQNSEFTASLLNIVFTPSNNTAYVHIAAVSSIEGYTIFDLTITVYGYSFLRRSVNPCEVGLPGLCPMVAAKTNSPAFNLQVGDSATSQIPGIAYTFPDLDAKVRVLVNMTSGDNAGKTAACLELNVSNGKTVDLAAIKWASAMVILVALLASALIDYLGHFNAASHVRVSTIALFSYMQAQAMIGLCGITFPPVVQAWTQNFQWSLGIIKIGFMQKVLTWYQRSTGGTPSNLFTSLEDVSVAIDKRGLLTGPSIGGMDAISARSPSRVASLARRSLVRNSSGSYVVYGIQRVAFKAGIDPSNIFMTMIGFFTALMALAVLLALLAKVCAEVAVRMKWVDAQDERAHEYRHGWRTIMKGLLFRCALAGFPAVVIFCLYEFTQKDSAAEIVNAVFYFLAVTFALAFASYNVIRIASRSISLHRNPAYILFSDPHTLNKWGAFYVQYRASGYYFSAPWLAYIFVKSCFIAFAQKSGVTQAIGLIMVEAAALITASVMRPWMDKSTNSFNVTICVVNFLNAIFLLIFCNVFDQPALANGIIGVVFWILNAAITLILLLMIIINTALIFFRSNPDARYQFMADDRTSFVRSQSNLAHNELDALAMTARGETPGGGSASRIGGVAPVNNGTRDRLLKMDDDTDSVMSEFRPPYGQQRRLNEKRSSAFGSTSDVASQSRSRAGSMNEKRFSANNASRAGYPGDADGMSRPPSMPSLPADDGSLASPRASLKAAAGLYTPQSGGSSSGLIPRETPTPNYRQSSMLNPKDSNK